MKRLEVQTDKEVYTFDEEDVLCWRWTDTLLDGDAYPRLIVRFTGGDPEDPQRMEIPAAIIRNVVVYTRRGARPDADRSEGRECAIEGCKNRGWAYFEWGGHSGRRGYLCSQHNAGDLLRASRAAAVPDGAGDEGGA